MVQVFNWSFGFLRRKISEERKVFATTEAHTHENKQREQIMKKMKILPSIAKASCILSFSQCQGDSHGQLMRFKWGEKTTTTCTKSVKD